MLPTCRFAPDLATTAIALGTAEFGSRIPADEAFRILDRYHALGGDHLDTAHVYAAWLPNGTGASERTIGAWIRRNRLEGRIHVATKGAHFALDGGNRSRVRPECIAADLRESLDRLGLPRVSLYYLHRDDPAVPIEPLLETLERERRAGLIGAYAASNWSLARMQEAAAIARARGWAGFAANQVQWSLAEVAPEGACGHLTCSATPAMRAWHREAGLPLAAYSPQAQGFFAREWTWPVPVEGRYAVYLREANVRRWRRVADRAAALGVGRNRLALAWLLCQPQPVLAVAGCRNVEQVDDTLAAAQIRLQPAELAGLEAG